MFDFADDLGPRKIIHIDNPTVKLKAIVAYLSPGRTASISESYSFPFPLDFKR